ncbi:MAG: branched-chain-amino-acid transaminase [Candidatus Bipolaricaulota bacterium]
MSIYSEEAARYLWRNGEIVPWSEATVHVNAVGHASVAGIFEGIKAYWNPDEEQLYVFRMRDHYRRFLQSIKMTRFAFHYALEDLEVATQELLRANEYRRDVYIRPYVFQQGLVRELLQARPGKPVELVIDSWPFEAYRDPAKALDVCTSSWTRIADNVMPPRLKCFSNYHNGRLAAMEAVVSGYDWPVLLDAQGKVTEGPGACLALVRDGAVVTPPTTSSVLESVTRDTVAYIVRDVLGLPFVERHVDRTELYVAEEMFFMGTGWEIMPVASVDRLPVGEGAPGSVTASVRDVYAALVRGLEMRRPEWRTAVW